MKMILLFIFLLIIFAIIAGIIKSIKFIYGLISFKVKGDLGYYDKEGVDSDSVSNYLNFPSDIEDLFLDATKKNSLGSYKSLLLCYLQENRRYDILIKIFNNCKYSEIETDDAIKLWFLNEYSNRNIKDSSLSYDIREYILSKK